MPQDQDLKSLDGLIIKIGGADGGMESVGPCGLLLEHLQAARRGLMGSMRAEYGLSLDQASQSLACIQGKSVRNEITKTLRGLIESKLVAKRPSATTN